MIVGEKGSQLYSFSFFKQFSIFVAAHKTPLKISARLLIIFAELNMVNWFGNNPFFTSFQYKGIDTVAPFFGLKE